LLARNELSNTIEAAVKIMHVSKADAQVSWLCDPFRKHVMAGASLGVRNIKTTTELCDGCCVCWNSKELGFVNMFGRALWDQNIKRSDSQCHVETV
jgi:hypothetical protein